MDKPNYYAVLPAQVRYDDNLTPNAKLLYAEITALTNANGVCWAGDQYFMKLYNVSRPTVQRWLKSLEDNGYVKREVIYKEDTNEIEKRYIRVYSKSRQGYTQNRDKGIHNNETVNITSINTISNNVEQDLDVHKEVIEYLNQKANRSFEYTSKENIKLINGRLNDGHTLRDFKRVIDAKVEEWGNNERMKQYLRPSTLFRKSNFDDYIEYVNSMDKEIAEEEEVFGELL